MRIRRFLGFLIAILVGLVGFLASLSSIGEFACNFLPCESILLSPTPIMIPNPSTNSTNDLINSPQPSTATTAPTKTLQDIFNENEATYSAQSTATARAQPTKYP